MKEDNSTLPENINSLLTYLKPGQAVPIGDIDGVPFVVVRISEEEADHLVSSVVQCEVKPSILNINYNEETLAICFVQLRLNSDDNYIFTLTYDLKEGNYLKDCISLLNMKQYGLLVATQSTHEFLSFQTDFKADFDPRNMVSGAADKATNYSKELFDEVVFGITSQSAGRKGLWDVLQTIAPFEHSWYASMDMGREKE